MSKDAGKVFEAEIKASIPPDFFVERYKDDTAGFYGVANPADFRLYRSPYTLLWELKTHKGKSIPLAKIRNSQLKGMGKAHQYTGVFCGFILNYRDLEETYYINFNDLVKEYYTLNAEGEYMPKPSGRKSIPVAWCRECGVRVPQILKRVRYSYDLRSIFGRYYDGKEM